MTRKFNSGHESAGKAPPLAFVVDDDLGHCEALAGYLRDKGLAVEEFHDGLDAAEAVPASKPSVVFMDVDMPLVDGVRAARRLLEKRPGTTIVLMSGYAAEVVRAKHAMDDDLAALTVLRKPLHPQELQAIVSGVLRRNGSGRRVNAAVAKPRAGLIPGA